jgi:pimeloyl-ACP methyl ester carboxylesterase
VPFRGYRTWYRVVGDAEQEGKLPVLYLHGGPGGTDDYLESLEPMAETGRRAIFYDQLGCGKSDLPDDTSLWTVATFVDEERRSGRSRRSSTRSAPSASTSASTGCTSSAARGAACSRWSTH